MKYIFITCDDGGNTFHMHDNLGSANSLSELVEKLREIRSGYDDDAEVTFEHDAFARFLDLIETKCMKSRVVVKEQEND